MTRYHIKLFFVVFVNFVVLTCLPAVLSGQVGPAFAQRVIYVDDDLPADFTTIQAAIDDANDGDTVVVKDGTYTGDGNRDIDFKGKAITVKSEQGPETCIIQCGGVIPYSGPGPRIEPEYHRGFYFHSQEDANSVVQGFTVTGGYMRFDSGGAFLCEESSPTIKDCIIVHNIARGGGGISAGSDTQIINCIVKRNVAAFLGTGSGGGLGIGENCRLLNCLIVGNMASDLGGGMACSEGNHQIINCTIAANRAGNRGGGISIGPGGGYRCSLHNSIVWGNVADREGDDIELGYAGILFVMRLDVSNSLIGDDPNDIWDPDEQVFGQWLMADPLFVRNGYWDPNDTINNPNDDFWVDGDYHLKSQAGRWDSVGQTWILDDITSPCIDAGDPNSPIMYEPFPNGGIINMGAYGGTAEASKSYFGEPPCETIIAGDINGDCKIDLADIALLLSHWLYGYPADQNEPNNPSGPDPRGPER